MNPTLRAVYVALFGSIFALLPVLVATRLWAFWPIFLGWFLLVLGLDALLAPRRPTVALEVETPPILDVGVADRATLTVTAQARWSARIELRVDLSEHLAREVPPLARLRNGRAETGLTLLARRRGNARLEAVWIAYTGPLGLMRFVKRVVVEREIPVVVRITGPPGTELRFFGDSQSPSGLKIERLRGEGTEFDSLKEYVPGDDTRAIEWKSTARHKKIMCRVYRAERNHQVLLAVDCGHLMSERLGDVPRLDHALRAALQLAYVGLQSGDRVGFYTFESRVGMYLPPQAGMRAHRRITEMTGRVEYTEAETNFTLGLTSLAQRVRRRSLIVVLTDFVDTVTAELMIENLSRLAHRHLVLFVSLRDPGLSGTASAVPTDAAALSRSVLADGMLCEREVVLRRLRRMGILSIDAEPDQIGPHLINGYLEIKRRERI